MAVETIKRYNITSTGLNETLQAGSIPSVILILADGGSATLAANITVAMSGNPAYGTTIELIIGGGIDLSGHTIDFLGYGFQQYQVSSGRLWYAKYIYTDDSGTISGMNDQPYSLTKGLFTMLDAGTIIDATVTLAKLENLTSAQIIVGNASNRPTATAVTGDVTINNAGVTAIGAGKIFNAMISATAAIARSKFAAGTAGQVVINDGSGVMSSEAQLAASRGGLGTDASASTGFVTFNAGAASISAITETLRVDVSFESGWQGTYYVRVPYACTVTAAKARVTKAIAGTDDATVTLKDNSGTTMTSGTLTLTASSAHGTGFTCTPSANNTLTANQEIQLLVAKTTAGGACSVDITVTRTS